MSNIPRNLLILAATLALLASLLILTSTTEGREFIITEEDGYEETYQLSWYQTQGA